jgi:hypothetical protein
MTLRFVFFYDFDGAPSAAATNQAMTTPVSSAPTSEKAADGSFVAAEADETAAGESKLDLKVGICSATVCSAHRR